jgi:hypothetical protein
MYQTDAKRETGNLVIEIFGSELFAILHQKLISVIKLTHVVTL